MTEATRQPHRSRRLPYRVERERIERERTRASGSLRSQFRRHSVALISLVVAIVSLGYNTWRNETSEMHRNWRQAAFQATIEVNQLQQIVLYRRYFHGREEHPLEPMRQAETWIQGWGTAISVRDLTSLLPEPLPNKGEQLRAAWEEHAGDLHKGSDAAKTAEEELLEAIDETRQAILELISQLS